MASTENLVTVGKITSVYGVKGWVKIFSYTEPMENIFSYKPWYLQTSKGLKLIDIDENRRQGQGIVAHIKNIDDRDEAKKYCQLDILVDQKLMPDLQDGDYYWHQLEGLQVYSITDGQNVLLGTISKMLETGANDVMVVSSCEGSVDKEERLIPYLPSQYSTKVDLSAGCLSLDWDPVFL